MTEGFQPRPPIYHGRFHVGPKATGLNEANSHTSYMNLLADGNDTYISIGGEQDANGDSEFVVQMRDGVSNGGAGYVTRRWLQDSTNPENLPRAIGRWLHLVFTYDGRGGTNASEGLQLYVDGKKIPYDNTTTSGGPYVGLAPDYESTLQIGNGFSSQTYTGFIAESAFWKTVLSQEEILAIFNATQADAYIDDSGYMSNPVKVLLQDLDNRPGAYPNVGLSRSAIGGHHEAHGITELWQGDVTPFDDTRSINFEDPFARSTVVVNKLPRDARFIRLIDGEGTVTTFEFQRGVILRDGSVAVDLKGRTKTMYRRRRAFLKRKIRNATRGSKYRKIDSQKLKDRIWAEFAAERFAAAVNGNSIKMKARAEDNNVYLTQQIPGSAGNKFVFVMPPDATVEVPEAYTVIPFTGGVDSSLVYPLCIQPQYINAPGGSFLDKNPIVASPSYLTGSSLDDLTLSKDIIAPGIVRKGVSDNFLAYTQPRATTEDAYAPFVDSAVILDEDDEFFDEGVPETLIENFNSPLRDKVMIVIDVDPVESTGFGWATGQAKSESDATSGVYSPRPQHIMVYYNFADRKWEGLRGITGNLNEGATGGSGLLIGQYETALREFPVGFSRGVELNSEGLKSACRPIDTYGFPFHPKFHATGSQTLRMGDYIDAPFVFEKYVLEFSGSYSNGRQYGFVV